MDFEQLKGRCKALAQVGDEQANATLRLFEERDLLRKANTELHGELTRVRSELAKKNIEGSKTPAAMTEGLAGYMLSQIKRIIENSEKFGILFEQAVNDTAALKRENDALKEELSQFLGMGRVEEVLAQARKMNVIKSENGPTPSAPDATHEVHAARDYASMVNELEEVREAINQMKPKLTQIKFGEEAGRLGKAVKALILDYGRRGKALAEAGGETGQATPTNGDAMTVGEFDRAFDRSPEELAAAATRAANGMADTVSPEVFRSTKESAGHKSEGTGI